MNFLISEAWADVPAAAAGQQASAWPTLFLMIGMFVVFYFLLIRPQTKRAKEHRAMIAALAKGDEVVTSGGLLGRITELADTTVTLEVASGVNIKIQRHAVQSILPKGTVKSA